MATGESSDRNIDIVLGIAAALLVVMHVVADVESPAPSDVSSAVLTQIEEVGITLDADRAMQPATRVAIGLAGKEAASPAYVLHQARAEIAAEHADSRSARLVWAAVAISFRLDQEAGAELDKVADDTRAKPLEPAIKGLRELAAGQPTDIAALTKGLRALGTSPWLSAALVERDLANRGDEARRALADQHAMALAVQASDTDAAQAAVVLGLGGLGLLAFIAVPLVVLRSRRLREQGHVGLATASPFRLDRTRRVMFLWFILFRYSAWGLIFLLSPLMVVTDGALSMTSLAIYGGLQTILSLFFAVTVIRKLALKPEITTSLTGQLGLGLGALPGGWRGLAAWALPALGMVTLATTATMWLTFSLLGPPNESQDMLVAVREGDTIVFLVATLGAAIAAPIGEEILFRGFLFRNLRDTLGPWPAIVLSGFIFGAVHMSPPLLLPLAAMGMVLALLYQWSNSLLVPITAHALWNLLNLLEAHTRFNV